MFFLCTGKLHTQESYYYQDTGEPRSGDIEATAYSIKTVGFFQCLVFNKSQSQNQLIYQFLKPRKTVDHYRKTALHHTNSNEIVSDNLNRCFSVNPFDCRNNDIRSSHPNPHRNNVGSIGEIIGMIDYCGSKGGQGH